MATCTDTQNSSWVFVDATVFAVFAGLSEDIWSKTVSGFLDYSLGGAARVQSATLTSSASRSFLMVAPTPTVSRGLKRVLTRKVSLTDFRYGYVTGLLLALPVFQALMRDGGSSAEPGAAREPAIARASYRIEPNARCGPKPSEAYADATKQWLGGRCS